MPHYWMNERIFTETNRNMSETVLPTCSDVSLRVEYGSAESGQDAGR